MAGLAQHSKVTVRSGQGVGKTWTAARLVQWFLYSFPYSIVITTAPTFRQVVEILWTEIRRQWRNAEHPMGGTLLQNKLTIDDGWFALGLTTDDPDAFQGFHAENLLMVMDEASGIPKIMWEAADSILTSRNSRALVIGNPTDPSGEFARTHKAGSRWHKIHISCLESPNLQAGEIGSSSQYPSLVTSDWVEDKREKWGEASPLWKCRVLGEFSQEGTDTLIAAEQIEAAAIRQAPKRGEDEKEPPLELGVDPARYGDDRTVIAGRRGPATVGMRGTRKEDTMETVGRVIRFLKDFEADEEKRKKVIIKVDTIGIGAGVFDRLREQRWKVRSIDSSAAAGDSETYMNLRAEMWFGLADRFRTGEITIPNDEQLKEELQAVRFKFDSRSRYRIWEKDDVKKELGRSPDKADAILYCFAKPRSRPGFFFAGGRGEEHEQ